jgi:hypothetical protein
MWRAIDLRASRVFHGAVEGMPGVTIDRYGPTLVMQTFRDPILLGQVRPAAAHHLAPPGSETARPGHTPASAIVRPRKPLTTNRGGAEAAEPYAVCSKRLGRARPGP